jgi:hypothetical protein
VESNRVYSARRPLNGLLYLPQGDYDDGEFGGMKNGRGNRNTRRKLAPAPLCPSQIPFDQTRVSTRTAAVGSQRLTAWAMARQNNLCKSMLKTDWSVVYITFLNRTDYVATSCAGWLWIREDVERSAHDSSFAASCWGIWEAECPHQDCLKVSHWDIFTAS